MKNKKDKTTQKNKSRFINKSGKKQSHKKSRHSDKKAVKDMMDWCKPEEYDEYSDYCWDTDN